MEVWLAALPIIGIPALILLFGWELRRAGIVNLAILILLLVLLWQMPTLVIGATSIKALLLTAEIILILIGAVLLIYNLKKLNAFEKWKGIAQSNSIPPQLLTLIFAWFISSLLEGIAGFGTPVAIITPILVGLGIKPAKALILALIGNSTAVAFGALGTPIIVGIGSVTEVNIAELTQRIALLQSLGSIIVTYFLLWSVDRDLELGKRWDPKQRLLVAAASGISFSIPFYLTAVLLGPQLPSVLGGLIGLIIFTGIYSFTSQKSLNLSPLKLVKASWPLLFPIVVIMLVKLIPPSTLNLFTISIPSILGTSVSHNFNILTSPGILLVIAGLISMILISRSSKNRENDIDLRRIPNVFLVLLIVIFTAQLLMASGENSSSIASIPKLLASSLGQLGSIYILIATAIGVLGSFMSGSATVSNLLFSNLQTTTAAAIGFPLGVMLGLQAIGGAAGNPIALTNIIAGETTANIQKQTKAVLKHNLPFVFAYVTVITIMALLLWS